jgi:hypothetical protein
VATETATAANAERDEQLLRELLDSKTFSRSAVLRKLLLYLGENRGSDVSEYAIATEALGRPADFDSKIDATVRVQIGRLRRSLQKYYAEEATEHLRRAEVPIGSHQLCFIDVEATTALTVAGEDPPPLLEIGPGAVIPASTARPLIAAPLGYAILVMVAVGVLLLMRSSFRTDNQSHREVPLFWKQFLDNGKPMRIVLPAPVFFSAEMPNGGSMMVRDILVNDPAKWSESVALTKLFQKRHTPPPVWQGYTVASDTFASLQLARFLDGYGIRSNFSSSADLPKEIVDHENIVALGTKSSFSSYQSELDRLGFRMADFETKVTDLMSDPDKPREFLRVSESGSRLIVPGIIALIPKENSDSRLLLVQGSQTAALIAYLTSEEGMNEIREATRKMNTPYFEAVVLSEVNRDHPLQSRLGAIRPFQESPTKIASYNPVNPTK